jgi:hypothetical protein
MVHMRIGVTGHIRLTAQSFPLIRRAIAEALAGYDTFVGVSCLAGGADTIFAEVVLERGCALEAVLPSADYRSPRLAALTRRAGKVTTLPFAHAGPQAYAAANDFLVDSCDELFAVWDGQPGVDRGSTASLVAAARSRGLPVRVIWPEGARRS